MASGGSSSPPEKSRKQKMDACHWCEKMKANLIVLQCGHQCCINCYVWMDEIGISLPFLPPCYACATKHIFQGNKPSVATTRPLQKYAPVTNQRPSAAPSTSHSRAALAEVHNLPATATVPKLASNQTLALMHHDYASPGPIYVRRSKSSTPRNTSAPLSTVTKGMLTGTNTAAPGAVTTEGLGAIVPAAVPDGQGCEDCEGTSVGLYKIICTKFLCQECVAEHSRKDNTRVMAAME